MECDLVCSVCGQSKFPGDFYYYHNGPQAGKRAGKQCKPCRNRRPRGPRKRPYDATASRKQVLRRFGITQERYEEMYDAQNGLCAICHRPPSLGQGLAIDHDHSCCPSKKQSCGKCVRGLLCSRCNVGLGMFQDDQTRIIQALAYLAEGPYGD